MSNISATLVETPTEVRETMGSQSYEIHTLCRPSAQVEREFRHTLDSIFSDLININIHEPALVAAYLDGIEQPLRELGGLGLRPVRRHDAWDIQATSELGHSNFLDTYYFVALKNSYFAIGSDLDSRVHRFDPDCVDGVRDLASVCAKHGTILPYPTVQAVILNYEGAVAWCPTCCLDDIASS